ncbi:uncharacterized protein MELLADRAFT_76784 [Melampsora larici-populina 98AG31]|uniref:Methyltransferase domain-containing protein n=1 Tax=Melampsora larici-populina (strain 98AG31 / pathotype 3-4-7) TaxID=747676 RepID=F4R9P7_MELLP|nr:uncharacterized protein MELLADRAFT_76784 [Melampsora larici-populina 98AG31]EGG11017.1 hypothetical protein MELLADRAFT_76784 [Melampsora larici-populina 98AG31]
MPHLQNTLESKQMTTKFHHPLKQPINPLFSAHHEEPQQQAIEVNHRSTTSFSKKQLIYQFKSTAPSSVSPTQSTSSLSPVPSPMTTISNGSILSSSSCHKTIDHKASSDPPTSTFSKPSWSKKKFSFTTTTPSHSQSAPNSKKSIQSQRKQFPTPHSYYPWFIKLENDEKHHPFDPDQIPYWLSYEPEVMDHYTLMMYASSNDPFRLPFTGPTNSELPKVILDLGCGPYGTWSHAVIQKYGDQTQTELKVIGLDICPVQSVYQNDGFHQLQFIQHDFLNYLLPFPDDTFDYIHSSFIATGVPEDKWSKLLEELLRVLKPGKKLEIIETNLNPNLKTYEILDTRFISPFPLSIIPAQLSMLDGGSSVERRRIEFEEINPTSQPEVNQNIFILENHDKEQDEKKIKKSKKSLDLNHQMNSNWNLLNHTHHLSLKVSQARGAKKPSNLSKPTPASTFTDTTSGMISKLLIERFGWNPEMDQRSFQSLKKQYQHYSSSLTSIEMKISNYRTVLKTFYNSKDLSIITTHSATERIEHIKELIDKLLLQKSETKKLFQTVRNELHNVKNRLGCEIDLGYCLGVGEKNVVTDDEKVVNVSKSIRIESFLVLKN